MAQQTNGMVEIYLKNFKKGLNNLVNATQIKDDELQDATNCLLADEGSVTKRWGSGYFGNAGSSLGIWGIFPYYGTSNTKEILIQEGGFIKKYNTSTLNWDLVSGSSFASGITMDTALLNNTLYLSNGTDNLAKYSGNGLISFISINAPTSNWAVRGGSFASGQYIYSYRVSAVNTVGETLACAATTIAMADQRENWNPDSTNITAGRNVTINWNAVAGAAGYNIYGVVGANETYIDHIDGQGSKSWVDYGTKVPSQVFTTPSGDTTTAPKGKYITEFKSSLLLVDASSPSRIWYSAGVDKPESFLISDGGGYVDISKNGEDGDITGVKVFQNKAIIFKERSIWSLDFTESTLPSIQTISRGMGCVSHWSIQNVENDLFFVGAKPGGGAAIYVLGNEPNYTGGLRTNELSARVRPQVTAINRTNFSKIKSIYYNNKYMMFYVDGNNAYNNAALAYDRERLGFTFWNSPNVSNLSIFYDTTGKEWLIFSDPSDNRVSYLDETLTDDKGNTIIWQYRTKELTLDDPYILKNFRWIKVRFRDTQGVVQINIYRDSNTNIYNYDTVLDTSRLNTSFGSGKFGVLKFGRTVSNNSGTPSDILIRRIPVMRIGHGANGKSISIEVVGQNANSKATLLDAKFTVKLRSKNNYDRNEIINN